MSVGTGGTLTGVGEVLRGQFPGVIVVAVEPDRSAVLSGGAPGPHKIQGIGAGFVPPVLNTAAFDRVARIGDEEAYRMKQRLAREEGLLVGISAGAAMVAALALAAELGPGKDVVTVLCDTAGTTPAPPLTRTPGDALGLGVGTRLLSPRRPNRSRSASRAGADRDRAPVRG